jgi:hypothetical protein
VVLQLAAPGDKIEDSSVAWAITTLGTLTGVSVVPDSEATERAHVLAGAPAGRHRTRGPDDSVPQQDDPVSYERRHQSPAVVE